MHGIICTAALAAFVGTAVFADNQKHVIMHIENKTNYDFVDGSFDHHEVNVDSTQTTIPAGQTGEIEFHFNEAEAGDLHMDVTYSVDGDNGNVKANYSAKPKNGLDPALSYDCSISAPNNIDTSHNDCSDKDVHYIYSE